MAAHPQISKADAKTMVTYIMSLSDPKANNSIGLKGDLSPTIPQEHAATKGVFVVRATYLDKGNKKMAPVQSEKWVLLRHPFLNPEKADVQSGIEQLITPSRSTNMIGQNPFVGFKSIDLTGIKSLDITATAPGRSNASGGVIEVHVGSPTGPVIGKTSFIAVAQGGFGGPPPAANPNAAQKGAPLGTPVVAPTTPAQAGGGGGGMRRGAPMPAIKVDIQATNGMQDLYFVAVNPKATVAQTVVQIIGIEAKL
jgi:cytochrome c